MSFEVLASRRAFDDGDDETFEILESLKDEAFEDCRESVATGNRHVRGAGNDAATSAGVPVNAGVLRDNTVYFGTGGEVATDLQVASSAGGVGPFITDPVRLVSAPSLVPTSVRGTGRTVIRRTLGLASSLFSVTLSSSSDSGGMPRSSRRASFNASLKSFDGGGRRGSLTSLKATLL